jgi:hypothetical protein
MDQMTLSENFYAMVLALPPEGLIRGGRKTMQHKYKDIDNVRLKRMRCVSMTKKPGLSKRSSFGT